MTLVCAFCRAELADADAERVHAAECESRAWWLANFGSAKVVEAQAPVGLELCRWCGSLFEKDEVEGHATQCGQRRWLELNFAPAPEVAERPPPIRLDDDVEVKGGGLGDRFRRALKRKDPRLDRLRAIVARANAIRDAAAYAALHAAMSHVLALWGLRDDEPKAASSLPLVLGTIEAAVQAAEAIEQRLDGIHQIGPMTIQRELENLEARGEASGAKVEALTRSLARADVLEQQAEIERGNLDTIARRIEGVARKVQGSGPAEPAVEAPPPRRVEVSPEATRVKRPSAETKVARPVLDPIEVRSISEKAKPANVLQFARTAKIGPYQLVGLLGAGGMGVVYEARSPQGRRVALKTVRFAQGDPRSEVMIRRFVRECRILRRLQHPGCVALLDAGREGGEHYLALELVDGLTLGDILSRRKLTLEEAIRLGVDLTDAVAYLHDAGIIHRDLKPSNVMVKSDGSVVLTDFGISRMSEATDITAEGDVIGTPGYVAPEVVLGEPVSYASDQWAIGRILLSAVAESPALGSSDSFRRRLKSGASVDFSTFPKAASWQPFRDVLERLLATEPDRRFGGVREAGSRLAGLSGRG